MDPERCFRESAQWLFTRTLQGYKRASNMQKAACPSGVVVTDHP